MAFGKELKRLREDVPISAQKLADLIGVNVGRLRKWEQLDQKPRTEDAQKIESFFNLNLTEIQKLDSIKKFINVPRGTIFNSGTIENLQKAGTADGEKKESGFNMETAFKMIINYFEDLKNAQQELWNQGQIIRREVSGLADYLMLKDAKWDQATLTKLKETYYSIVRGGIPEASTIHTLKKDGKSNKGIVVP